MLIGYIYLPQLISKKVAFNQVKSQGHIPSMLTVNLTFFPATARQHKTNKIGITYLASPKLKLCIFKINRNKNNNLNRV